MKYAKPLLLGLFLLAILVLGFVLWASYTMGPDPEAFAALRSDEHVTVSLDQFIVFRPAKKTLTTGFVFYPGGRIDYRSYAAPLRRIAAEGYLVVLLPVRLNLAVLDLNAAQRAISAFPEIKHWVVGGHSLGGVAAASFAVGKENVDGVVFWAAYPGDETFKRTNLKILSIYGTLDLSGVDRFKASRDDLPADAEFVIIEGGNHSQFGHYGLQPGDHPATITPFEQQRQAVRATVRFLKEITQ